MRRRGRRTRPRLPYNRRGVRHTRAGALAQAQISLRTKLGVGVHHDPPRDAELARQVARGRYSRTGSQGAIPDRPAKLVLDLRPEGTGAVATHREKQLDRLTGLIYRHESGSSIWTSESLASAHALDRLASWRTTPVRHLDPRAAAGGDAQHRAPGAYTAPDGLVRRGRGGHRRVRGRARSRWAGARKACRPPWTDLHAARERERCRNADGRDRRLPAGASLAALVALAAGIGLATPPVGACLRTQLPALLPDPGAVRAAYALEASAVELTYIFGPPLALCIGALWSTGAALAVAGVVMLAATAAFAAQPASRIWRPAPTGPRPRGGSLRTPAMRALVIVLIAVGMLLGADEVAVTAAAKTLGSTTAAAPCSPFGAPGRSSAACSSPGSAAGRARRRACAPARRTHRRHLALIPADGSVLALGAVLLLAGAAIAPTEATVYAMVDRAAPAGTDDRGLRLARHSDGSRQRHRSGQRRHPGRPRRARTAFALAGGTGALAVITTILRARTITPGRRSPETAGADTERQLGLRFRPPGR